MSLFEPGLVAVSTDDLKKLLRAVYRQDIEAPLTVEALARVGLQHCASDILGHLRDLDERSIRAVVVAVIAERR